MTPKKFDYYAPGSLDSAIEILARDDEAKVLAGGQSLLALMKLRLAAPSALVDISRIGGLSYIREEAQEGEGSSGFLAIGALTTYDTIERSSLIKEKFRLLNDAVVRIGDQQIRNRGTIGGSVCHADPAADFPTALLASDARFVLRGVSGTRVVEAREFFVDVFSTIMRYDEILTEVRLPFMPPRSGTAFIKHSLREADFAIAMTAVALTLDEDMQTCADVRLAIGAAGGTPLRASLAEETLRHKIMEHAVIGEAAERAAHGLAPPSDVHGDPEYRLAMIKVLARRTVELALSRAEHE